MIFEYLKGSTNENDIIDHILMRLNTDFAGGSLQVPDFCRVNSYDYDRIMEPMVRDKMYRHRVAQRSTGRGQPETAIVLLPQGARVFQAGGWKKYLETLEQPKNRVTTQEREFRRPATFPRSQPTRSANNITTSWWSNVKKLIVENQLVSALVSGILLLIIERIINWYWDPK